MNDVPSSQVRLRPSEHDTADRLGVSASTPDETLLRGTDFRNWFRETAARNRMQTTRLPLAGLAGWRSDPDSHDLEHVSGKFFRVTGLEVSTSRGPVKAWSQPIIHQPEIGILGILIKEFDGVLYCLIQGKVEPGNCNGLQLSPTVQATFSNYSRVHGGQSVPYLDFFQEAHRHRVIVDVLQSEQGSWFYQKRNRNMVVETTADVPVLPDFRWLSLGQLHQLLTQSDLVNMDTRTVLSCLPFSGPALAASLGPNHDDFVESIHRSLDGSHGGLATRAEVLSWITEQRSCNARNARRIPLKDVDPAAWRRTEDRIHHVSERYFSIIGIGVEATGREVKEWAQPILLPHGQGLAAFLAAQIGGVLHVLVQGTTAPGYLDAIELGPTVQCTPENHMDCGPGEQPYFLQEVQEASWAQLRFDTVLSEEGGRFYKARTRYVICEVDCDDYQDLPEQFQWMTLTQLTELLQHSHYVNVEARTLVACLRSLTA